VKHKGDQFGASAAEATFDVTIDAPILVPWVIVDPWTEEGRFLNTDIGESDPVAVPEELYLRRHLRDLPEPCQLGFGGVDVVQDPSTLDAFMHAWGPLWIPNRPAAKGAEPGLQLELEPWIEHEIDAGQRAHPSWVHIEEARLAARALRATIDTWEALRSSKSMRWIEAAWDRQRLAAPVDVSQARAWVAAVVNSGLAVFHPRLILNFRDDPKETRANQLKPHAYEVMCAQLFNHIRENLPYRYCENETCRTRFVRQRGRARPGRGHTDAKYCTTSCAKAQAQRERRQQQRKGRADG